MCAVARREERCFLAVHNMSRLKMRGKRRLKQSDSVNFIT